MSTIGQQIDLLLQKVDESVRQYELLVDRIAQLESRIKFIENQQLSSVPHDGEQCTESSPSDVAKTIELSGDDRTPPPSLSPQEQTISSEMSVEKPAVESSFFALAQLENEQIVLLSLCEDAKSIAQFVVTPQGAHARVDFNNVFDYSSETLEVKLLPFVDYTIENGQCKEIIQQDAGDARLENDIWIMGKKVCLIIK